MPFSRILMIGAAVALCAVGLLGLFAPDVVLASVGGDASPGPMLVAQVFGTLSLGLASLDWMWKANRLGGIYGRPIVVANLLHFVSATLVMVKALPAEPALRGLWPVAGVYAALAAGFAVLLVRDPI